MNATPPWRPPVTAVSILVLLLAAVASLFMGRVDLSPQVLIEGVTTPGVNLAKLVVVELRLPRALLAILAGAALGLSGAVLQGLTRNPLAEPGLLGVTTGAALGAVISIYFGLAGVFALATPL